MIFCLFQNGIKNNAVQIFDHLLMVDFSVTKTYRSKQSQRPENRIISFVLDYIENCGNK